MTVDILSEVKPTARKTHRCNQCWCLISVGEIYLKSTIKSDYIYTLKSHLDCHEAWLWWYKRNKLTENDGYGGIPMIADYIEGGDTELHIKDLEETFPVVAQRLRTTFKLEKETE